ncbi:MAG: contractile injection system tape measure protein [bacterium]|nr:contractile injection system tape measure protein [bacterium]
MTDSNRYIIEKVSLEIDVNSVEQARKIEGEIQRFVREKVIPEIELFFEGIDQPDLHIQMEKISLNFDKEILSNPFWKSDLHKQLQKEFQVPLSAIEHADKLDNSPERITELASTKNVKVQKTTQSESQALSHFLKTGNAPWWMADANQQMRTFLEEKNILQLLEKSEVLYAVQRLFQATPVARKRWVLQFQESLQLAVLLKLTEITKTKNEAVISFLKQFIKSPVYQSITREVRHEIWFAALTFVSESGAINSTSKKQDFLVHIAQKFAPKSKKYLLEIAEKLVINQALPIEIGAIPPILFFSAALVTDFPEKQVKIAEKTLKSASKASFEITAFNSTELEWITTIPSEDNQHGKATDSSKEPERSMGEELEVENKSNEVEQTSTKKDQDSKKESEKNTDISSESLNDEKEQETPSSDQEMNSEKSEFDETVEEDWNKKSESETVGEGIYVENAGVLLMHPFFVPMLKSLNLLDEKKQLTDPKKAVLLLHFIATGDPDSFEHEMRFAKFLCNVDADEVMDKSMTLNHKDLEEVDNILHSALSHWKSLNSKSPGLLQHEFLQRPGKLFSENGINRVVMEEKTVDILMRDLPWGIGMIQLPWMDDFLHVDWN